MNTSEKFWDKTARKYSRQKIKDEAGYQRTLEDTKKYLGPEKTVLEIGCGTGTTALKLAGFVKELIATDISAQMIEIANEKADAQRVHNVRFSKGTLFDESLAPESFDVILAYNLIHLLEDTDRVLRRIYGLLRPGGYFISKTPCLREKSWLMPVVAFVMSRVVGVGHLEYWTIGEWETAIKNEGFEIIETHRYPPKPIRLFAVARKD